MSVFISVHLWPVFISVHPWHYIVRLTTGAVARTRAATALDIFVGSTSIDSEALT